MLWPNLLLLLAISFPFLVVSHSNKNTPPVIINFGDSNSDTGGISGGLGLDRRYPNGRIFPGGPTGDRYSDGRLIIDFLCQYLGVRYLSAYLNSVHPKFSNGINFAVGGAGASTFPTLVPFNLDVQIRQFTHFYNRSIHLHSKGVPNLIGEEGFKNALYTIDIGQNDLTEALSSLSFDDAVQKIPSFVSAIGDAIRTIHEYGGRNFWIHNSGPLGCLPRELARHNNASRDKHRCLTTLNDGVKLFNAKLYTLCEELQHEMKDSTIVHVDVYSIKYDIIANPSLNGFETPPLMACCGYGGPPYNFNARITCTNKRRQLCEEHGPPYINWDGIHYTEVANFVVVSKILSTEYLHPRLNFDFFCNRHNAIE